MKPTLIIDNPVDMGIASIRQWALDHYGYDANTVRLIMAYFNITEYEPRMYWLCRGLIQHYHKEEEARKLMPVECPICKAKTFRDMTKDNLFGGKYGWGCTENEFHFMYDRVNALRQKLSGEEQSSPEGVAA